MVISYNWRFGYDKKPHQQKRSVEVIPKYSVLYTISNIDLLRKAHGLRTIISSIIRYKLNILYVHYIEYLSNKIH